MLEEKQEKLQVFNAFGMVNVSNEHISVILSALTPSGRPINRTIKQPSPRPLGFEGAALISVMIDAGGFLYAVHELGETYVIEHPLVQGALKDAVDWIRASARI